MNRPKTKSRVNGKITKSVVLPPSKSKSQDTKNDVSMNHMTPRLTNVAQVRKVPRLAKNPMRHALTPEAKARQVAALKPIKPGEVRNPNGRPKKKPFHEAALKIATEEVGPMNKKSHLRINPTDTVAVAVAKSLAATAVSGGQQSVSASKELADRAEGPVERIMSVNTGTEIQTHRGVNDLLVRFGIQLEIGTDEGE